MNPEYPEYPEYPEKNMNTIDKVKLAKEASIQLAACGTELKNRALEAVAAALRAEAAAILAANKADLAAAEAAGLAGPLLKRLAFNEKKLEDVVEGVESLVKLEDPVGKKLRCTELDEGLILTKVSCPIGVIGVIFESRPDALVQISTLCLKSGNAAATASNARFFSSVPQAANWMDASFANFTLSIVFIFLMINV